MKKLLLIISIVLLFSCENKTNYQETEYTGKDRVMFDSIKESLLTQSQERVKEEAKTTDTLGMYKSPVKILKAYMVDSESGRYRNIRLQYKNVSALKVTAIKFMWKGENAFLEPADMGNPILEGYGGGFTDDVLKPNETTAGTWSILSKDAKTVEAWVTEVVFEDRTKWKLNP